MASSVHGYNLNIDGLPATYLAKNMALEVFTTGSGLI